jgi:hypothetical protein
MASSWGHDVSGPAWYAQAVTADADPTNAGRGEMVSTRATTDARSLLEHRRNKHRISFTETRPHADVSASG